MTLTHRLLLIAGAGTLLIGLILFGTAVSWYDTAISLEEATTMQYQENQNQYDSFWKKVKETAQVPDKYKEDFKELLVSETQAKFGPQGSQAAFQWFKDRDINFSDKLYTKVQDVIEAGRNDFKRSQTDLLDKQRKYRVHVHSFFGRMWAGIYDMPHALSGDLAPPSDQDGDGRLTALDYNIVTSGKTKKTFASGEENEVVKVFE
jgi:hypothetical protein